MDSVCVNPAATTSRQGYKKVRNSVRVLFGSGKSDEIIQQGLVCVCACCVCCDSV